MKDFFISYNGADRRWAEWIAWVLEEQGYRVIIQAWDFRPGGNFILDMQRATAGAERTVMVLSAAYLNALYTQPEWAAAFQQDPTARELTLLPIRVSPCEPTGMLAALVYVDLVEQTEAEAEALLQAALQARGKPATRPSFPRSVPEPERVTPATVAFPPTKRGSLFQKLASLTRLQFEQVLFGVNPPADKAPSASANQSDRVKALLDWADHPNGCGLDQVEVFYSQVANPLQASLGAVPLGVRIFISYKRNVSLDESVALEIFEALRYQHRVFIDQTMVVGTSWAERIQAEIRQSGVLIVVLSEQSVHSEMVELEVRLAHQLASESGRPRILPIRLAYREAFQYPLSEYLNPLNWAFWDGPADTPNLIAELQQAISGGPLSVIGNEAKTALLQKKPRGELPRPLPSAQPIPLESPEQGTMDPESRFYIERAEDSRAQKALQAQEGTLIIKGSRQMGKSSLLNRVMATAVERDRQVVFLDFQLFDQPALNDRQRFFRQFCTWITDELDLPNRIDEYWQVDLPLPKLCTSYMNRYLLKALETPVILAMDEVDRAFNTDFRSDFFSMLRSWHNKRATSKLWKRFSQILVISTEPYQLIEDLNQSPFNVGQTLRLSDLTESQAAELNRRHGRPLTAGQMRELMRLLAGHPYLVRRALYLIATDQYPPADFFATAVSNQGPFGEHLRRHLFRLTGKAALVQGLMQIIDNQTCTDEQVIWRLEGAGLVKREGKRVVSRCQLYADYFREHVHD